MANDTVCARPGALKLALKSSGITQKALADKIGCSRSTLQTIDAGKKVKSETLNEVADALRIPVTHLLPEAEPEQTKDDGPGQVILGYAEEDGAYAEIRLPRVSTTDDLRKALSGAKIVNWSLRINDLSDDLAQTLAEFESRVAEFRKNLRPAQTSPSLMELIEVNKQQRGMGDHIQKLSDLGVYLYAASYAKWEKEDEGGCDFYDYKGWVDFKSHREAIFVLERRNQPSTRVETFLGHTPPRYATPDMPRIKVNDAWLKTKEETEKEEAELNALLSDLLPDDDIPF